MAAAAAFLAGASGFGFGLLATPLLLLAGFPLPFVVTINLALSLTTRVSVAVRFRRHVHARRASMLVLGSIPGLLLGVQALTYVDRSTLTVATGVLVMVLAVLIAFAGSGPPPRSLPGAPLLAGFAGGFLGTSTSLVGVPPALLLARERVAARGVYADLAVYFVAASGIGLAVLAAAGELAGDALYPTLALWLPGALLGNLAGTAVGLRLPQRAFRLLALTAIFVAGTTTAITA